MKITELEGKLAKLSPHSITVKTESGKTCGIIRADCFNSLCLNRTFDFWKQIQSFGIRDMGHLYLADGKLYYLYDTISDDFFFKYIKDKWEQEYVKHDEEKYNKRQQLLKTLRESNSGIEVVTFHSKTV